MARLLLWNRTTPLLIGAVVFVLTFLSLLKFFPSGSRHVYVAPPQQTHDNDFPFTKALIIPKTRDESIDWIYDNGFNETHGLFVYTMSTPPEPGYHIPRTTQGREAVAFLTYIVDNYAALPQYSIFIHARATQHHNDVFGPTQAPILRALRTDAIDAAGYVNLRCALDPGCPVGVNPHDPTPMDLAKSHDARAQFVEIYSELFAVPAAEVPRQVGGVCCAQFAVTRARLRARPRSDYERMLKWVATTTQVDNFAVGWVMEKVWHVVFGMGATHCPRYEQCRCDLYGWCGPLPSGEMLRPAVKGEL